MAQLTVFNPDYSCADVILISDSLRDELRRIFNILQVEEFNLFLLKKIKRRVLAKASRESFSINIEKLKTIASDSLNWFDELLDVISRIEKLPNRDCLTICLSE
ncbi:MAG: hypothetical protein QNJ60_06105 [Xenococcaceae cyanobacterium MO_188.B19]|nr:hypothetical protein [Xenococcaceae cyanobacterium MO_188.B19]